jgi:RNase P/RNase MRP subunit p29
VQSGQSLTRSLERNELLVRILALAVAFVIIAPQVARSAGNPQQVTLSGTIVSADAATLVIDTSSGRKKVSYNSKIRFFVVSRSALADVTAGSFIGTTVAPQPDGTFKSTEAHIFAPSLRGTGEGFTQMNDSAKHMMANSTVRTVAVPNMMANSTVRAAHSTATGTTVTMIFPSGTKRIVIPSDVPVVYIERGTPAMLTPGAHVRVAAIANGDALAARFVLVGKNGLVPPM